MPPSEITDTKQPRLEQIRKILQTLAVGEFDQRIAPTGDVDLDRALECIVGNLRAGEKEPKSQLVARELAEALDSNSIGSWNWDVTTGAVSWSDKTYEIMGLSRSDTTPSSEIALSHVHPEDRQRYEAALKECMEDTGVYALHNRIVRTDGSVRHVMAKGRLHRGPDNELLRMFGTLRDVTEEHKKEAQVRSSLASQRRLEEQVPLTIEASPIAMLMVDRDHRIVLLNKKSEELFGYARTEILGMKIEKLVPEHLRAQHEDHRENYWNNPESRRMGGGSELHCRHKNGRLIPVDVTLSPVETPAGPRIIAAIVNLSVRRRLEEQVRQAQKLEAIGTLASGVAHEFNNLLMGVSGCVDIAMSTLESERPEHLYLNEIKQATERGASVTNQLLAFSRKSKAQIEVFDFNAVVSEMHVLLSRLLGEDIVLSVRIDADHGHVSADRGLMQQVLINLAVNARHAMPGGGKLTVETHNETMAQLNDFSLQAGEYILMTVADSGTGMTEEVRQRVFEPFYTTKESGQGTGLGLSIAYGITKEAGGHVAVESLENGGTTFKIFLPTILKMPAPTSDKQIDLPSERTLGTVLVVEDAPEVLMAIRFYLEQAGHKVLTATSGAEAVACCEAYAETIDLVVCDAILPGLSGAETYLRIRRCRPEIDQVVFISAHDSKMLIKRGQVERGVRTLQKPFGSEELLLCIQEALNEQ